MTEFRHLLVTKFNILTSLDYGPYETRLDDEWLREQLVQFETFCLPSVLGQQGAEFTWLVLCDNLSPVWFKERMRSYGAPVTPLFVSSLPNALMGQRFKEEGFTDAPFLISTRLDNDDALAVDYMARVQAEFRGQSRQFIEFRRGLRAFRGGLYSAYWRSNAFLTLIEQPSDDGVFSLVYIPQHHRVARSEDLKVIRGGPMWLRSVHEHNTSVSSIGWPRFTPRDPRFTVRWEDLPRQEGLGFRLRHSLRGYGARLGQKAKFRRLMSVFGR